MADYHELATHHEEWGLGDGQFRRELHLRPIAFARPGEQGLRRILNRVDASGDPLLPLGVDELLQFRCAHRIGHDAPGYHVGCDGSGLFMSPLNCNVVTPVVTGQAAYYPGAYPGADLRLTVGGHRLQKEILLREGHPGRFEFRLRTTRDFQPAALTCGRLHILQPALEREGMDSVPLAWRVAHDPRGWLLSCDLPAGDWAGWTLDPTVVIQPGPADGKDADLLSHAPTWNYGADTHMVVGERNDLVGTHRALIQFSLASVPDGVTITLAQLSLFLDLDFSSNARAYRTYRMRQAWVEGTQIGGLGTGVTWNTYDGSAVWPGGAGGFGASDCEQADIGSRLFSSTETLNEFKVITLTPTTKAGLDLGDGWMIKADSEANDAYAFRTSDHTTASQRPYLTITYTLPLIPIFMAVLGGFP